MQRLFAYQDLATRHICLRRKGPLDVELVLKGSCADRTTEMSPNIRWHRAKAQYK